MKSLDPKVVMQLVAGLKAEEQLVDAAAGSWAPWEHADAGLLLGVAVGQTEVVAHQANPQALPVHWHKFWALRQVWEHSRRVEESGPALRPIGPPPPVTAPTGVGSTAAMVGA